ncbi:uncharacterized protein [Typha latifolia]|uniref:uncharacterized protein n=1 Tax=Typha latifolia TaxID=4733 RepID=UPI003C2DEB6C
MEKTESQTLDPLLSQSSLPSPPLPYYAVNSSPSDNPPAYYLLPAYPVLIRRLRRRRRPSSFSCFLPFLSVIFLLSLVGVFLLYPSDPDLSVARLRLDRLHFSPPPRAALDLALRLDLRVRNKDFFALDYNSVTAAVSYRGRTLGSVASAGGRVRARGVSYLDAELRLDGIRVIDDAVYLIEDIARRAVPLDTITEVEGTLKLFFLEFPVKGKISCSLIVNPANQKIIQQDCYPE